MFTGRLNSRYFKLVFTSIYCDYFCGVACGCFGCGFNLGFHSDFFCVSGLGFALRLSSIPSFQNDFTRLTILLPTFCETSFVALPNTTPFCTKLFCLFAEKKYINSQ